MKTPIVCACNEPLCFNLRPGVWCPLRGQLRRGDVDEPVSIRALKRFVTDKFGPETGDYTHYHECL